MLLNQIKSDVISDEALKDGEKEGNDVPLGKIMKQIKAKCTRSRKDKKKPSLGKTEKAESGVDILQMVREINLDNLGLSDKFESSNGHKHEASEKTSPTTEHQKVKKRKPTDVASVPVPKRRRSSHSSSKSFLNTPFSASGDD